MALRCLLFTAETGTAEPIGQVLSALGVEGEHCADAVAAVDKVTHQSFQIVIIDWDQQPEASMLLTAARERKASDRALTLAIVNEDSDVPKALQAGANSILRRPILINQVRDTLTTARDLLKAKESAAMSAAAGVAANLAASNTPSSLPSSQESNKKNLRAGEFLPSSGPRPGGEFVVEGSSNAEFGGPTSDVIDPLMDLEPTAASVTHEKPSAPPPQPVAPPPPQDSFNEPRGLEFYLKRAGIANAAAPAPALERASPPAASSKPEILGFDQTPTQPAPLAPSAAERNPAPEQSSEQEKRSEDRLFAYIEGESTEGEARANTRVRLGKGPIIGALVLAACAVMAAPQAPWHGKVSALWVRGQRSLHAWLNPQPVTTPQAPESHESFGRAGDEYKLPVAETIPDATTDPSQIRVVPVIDPTAKKPASGSPNPDVSTQPIDGTAQTTADPAAQGAVTPGPTDQSVVSAPDGSHPGSAAVSSTPDPPGGSQPTPATNTSPANPTPTTTQPRSNAPSVPSSLMSPRPADPAGPAVQVPQAGPNATVAGPSNVPSSLKSQLASMTPDASGNKPPESAMPSIEPVAVPEAAERLLIAEQPAIAYPANAKTQQGSVTLQILIGRDGAVQDAKFLQGSLAFARAAIDGVKQWRFKPYTMNGRPVSVQTTLTISFKPTS
jgi:protein TonB